jgi:carbohydrate-binding DOMON domain-containing protein
MKRAIECGLATFLAVILAGSPAAAKVLLEIADPPNDDTGNGKYLYPTDASFGAGGEADLTLFRVEEDGNKVRFTLGFRDLVDPWRVGNRLTYAVIAVDTGKGGLEELGHNANARLAAPAERVLYYGGETLEMVDGEGNVLETSATVAVDVDQNTVVIEVPESDLGGAPKKGWAYTVAAGLQDDYGGGGLGDFRLVNAAAEQWRGGGGDDLAIDPNLYDLILNPKDKKLLKTLAPRTGTQAEIVGNYSLDENRLAVLPYVKR